MKTATGPLWYQGMMRSAVVASLFILVVGVLLIGNEIGRIRSYPFNAPQVIVLKKELAEIIKDPALTEQRAAKEVEIRQLDQRLRDEYFRREALAAQGKWLLLGGVAIFLLTAEFARRARLRLPDPTKLPEQHVWRHAAWSRWAVGSLGIVMVGSIAVMALFPPPDYFTVFAKAGNVVPVQQFVPSQTVSNDLSTGLATANVATPIAGTSSAISTPVIPPITPFFATGPTTPVAAAEEMLANWPFFRGPLATGIAFTSSPPMKWDGRKGSNILWKTAIPLAGKNSPIVWKRQVFVSGADEDARAVYALDADTGKIQWTHEVKGIPGSPSEAPGIFTDTGFAAPTMATDGQRVFALFANGDLLALDMTGKRVWARNMGLPVNNYGISSSLLVVSNKLVISYCSNGEEDSKVYAFDVGTGKELWTSPMPVAGSWASPILIDTGLRREIITAGNPFVIAYDPDTGKELWRADILSGDVASSPVFANGLVYVVNTGSVLAAIRPGGQGDVTKTRVAWQADEGLPDITSPLCDGDRVYLVTSDGILTCYDAHKGDKLWEHELEVQVHGSPTIVNGKIYIPDTEGTMHILEAGNKYQELGIAKLGETVETCPAFVGNRIYIRGEANIYCIGQQQ